MTLPAEDMPDTICAIATATGGALGIIRVSGGESIATASKIFLPRSKGKAFSQIPAGRAVFGEILDDDGRTLDEAIAVAYKAPRSYTGEDTVEFSCHGSPFILNRLLQILIAHGCRLANPGEFTERAFLNGKMDLSQAEAVADLIASRSEISHKAAISQLKGCFKDRIAGLREKVKNLLSSLELELDFSDHDDLDFAGRSELIAEAQAIQAEIQSLCGSFVSMNAVKSGVSVAIVGKTNVGKSTIMNALLSDSRAIVSSVPGTTRDIVEEETVIQGVEFKLMDTAGIRETEDSVERMGIRKTHEAMNAAQIIVLVMSAPKLLKKDAGSLCEELAGMLERRKTVIVVINKTDLLPGDSGLKAVKGKWDELMQKLPKPAALPENGRGIARLAPIFTSAKNNAGIGHLKKALAEAACGHTVNSADLIVINERHYQALQKANVNIGGAIAGMRNGTAADFVSQDLRELAANLAAISGEITSQEILNNIFAHFCVGK